MTVQKDWGEWGRFISAFGGDDGFEFRVINGTSVEKVEHGAHMYVYDD